MRSLSADVKLITHHLRIKRLGTQDRVRAEGCVAPRQINVAIRRKFLTTLAFINDEFFSLQIRTPKKPDRRKPCSSATRVGPSAESVSGLGGRCCANHLQ